MTHAPIAITAFAATCALGEAPGPWRARLDAGLPTAHHGHRFPRWREFPLAEADHRAYRAFGPRLGAADTRLGRLCLGLMERVVAEAALMDRYEPHEVGLFVGTTTAGLPRVREAHYRAFTAADPLPFARHLDAEAQHGSLLTALRQALGARGPGLLLTNSCAAGASALAEAKAALDAGLVKAAVAGGGDVLDTLTIAGFDALQILDRGPSLAFATERRGINLGEGAAFFVLEREDERQNPAWAYLRGAGQSSDPHHMTHPTPDGGPMAEAMRAALADAGLAPEAVAYVNTHGTGTLSNDAAEAAALARLWPGGVLYSATKPLHGHLLAGSGPLELAVCLEGLAAQRVWGRCYRNGSFLGMGQAHAHDAVLSNSFGFGGTNVSLVVTRAGNAP